MREPLSEEEDAFGRLLLDYLAEEAGQLILELDDGRAGSALPADVFFAEHRDWAAQEQQVFELVHGRVLDVGCGAGRHSLEAERRGLSVVAIDISPGAVEVCRRRGVRDVRLLPLAAVDASLGAFDTVLMMCGNFGLVGTARDAVLVLRTLHGMTTPSARIVLDSVDPHIQSPDGLSLYMASNRPGGKGLLDIWVAYRASTSHPYGDPVNLGDPINSVADDFCPTPVRGNGLFFFVSRKFVPGVTCGLGDIYFTRRNPAHGWSEPEHLGCAPAGPNGPLDEQGPSYVEAGGGRLLYFSSSRTVPQGGLVPGDIYVSARLADGSFGPAALVGGLSGTTTTATPANDIQPNVRKDGREVVFSSDRSGTLGGQDIWVATRDSVQDPWSAPANLEGNVNTAAGETRPSFSWDARQLLFGRAPGVETDGMTTPIPSDIYVSTRDKANGN